MTHTVHMYPTTTGKNSSGRLPKEFYSHEIPDPNVPNIFIEKNNLSIKSGHSFSDFHIEITPQHGPTT